MSQVALVCEPLRRGGLPLPGVDSGVVEADDDVLIAEALLALKPAEAPQSAMSSQSSALTVVPSSTPAKRRCRSLTSSSGIALVGRDPRCGAGGGVDEARAAVRQSSWICAVQTK
jgi:hypothetical protein